MKLLLALVLTLFASLAFAADEGHGTIVYGGSKTGDGWALSVDVPAGWREDCCKLAQSYGTNLLIYPADWSGHESVRLMKLVVWEKEKPSLDEEWAADEKAYRSKFPGVELKPFVVKPSALVCKAGMYTGPDHLNDYVVYCDLGKDWRYLISWSFAVPADVATANVEQIFRSVVASTKPLHLSIKK